MTLVERSSLVAVLVTIFVLDFSQAYSKYGRTCADIGCMTNEVCVMAEDPCYRRGEPCGSYPTCERKANAVSTCATFVCPPTTHCRMDGNTPKCIADNGPLGSNANPYENVDLHSTNNNNNNHDNDHRPVAPIYPQVPPRGQTTTRAPSYRPNQNNYGGGYQGGSIGSGYPGQSNNGHGSHGSSYPGYPGSNNGYSGGSIGSGYPGGYSGYPGQNTNNRNPYGGSASAGGGYSAYPNYPYQGQGGNTYNQNTRYGSSNSGGTTSNPLYDSLKDKLKSIGSKLLKDALGNFKL